MLKNGGKQGSIGLSGDIVMKTKLYTGNPHCVDRKNVYKIVDNVDNSENRRKYRKIAVNKNVRNYLAKRQIVWIRSKKRPCGKKENSIFHREQVKRKNDFIFRKQEAPRRFLQRLRRP